MVNDDQNGRLLFPWCCWELWNNGEDAWCMIFVDDDDDDSDVDSDEDSDDDE